MALRVASSQRLLLQPVRSSRHRTACHALYRALIRLALLVPLPDDLATPPVPPYASARPPGRVPRILTNPICILIHRQVHRNRLDVSHRLVFAALAAGYKFLSVLTRARDAGSDDHANLLQLLRDRRAEQARSWAHPPPQRPARPPPNPLLRLAEPRADGTPVYERARPFRPAEELSGRRSVPRLQVTTFGVPFLRLGKPQPPALSAYLHRRGRRQIAYADHTDRLRSTYLRSANDEDQWDQRLQDLSLTDALADTPSSSYTQFGVEAIETIRHYWNVRSVDHAAKARAMLAIVDEERSAREREDAAAPHPLPPPRRRFDKKTSASAARGKKAPTNTNGHGLTSSSRTTPISALISMAERAKAGRKSGGDVS